MDEVLIVAIIFGSLLGMLKLWLDYRRDRNQVTPPASGAEPSITTSELKALVADAVEEVVDRRFDQLERRLEKRDRSQLLPGRTSAFDDVELDH
ncbi:MAG: hypothetical protein WD205_10420, partial [Rhodothermales bacterium]